MNMQFPPDIQTTVKDLMASGLYHTEEEVLRVALAEMQARTSDNDLVAIQAGIDDMEAGRMIPWEEVKAKLSEKFGFHSEPNS